MKALVITPFGFAVTDIEAGADTSQVFHDLVGGWMDVVRPLNPAIKVVGYVHDEGLLMGLDPNPIACALFGRFLVGNVVVVGTLNSEGVDDGESYDVPSEVVDFVQWLGGAQSIWLDHLGVDA